MITKERLRELIEQGATIYKISGEIFIEVPSGLYSQEINDRLCCQPDYNLLFETKEEAEWQLEFGNITRTETLELPTWEEVCKRKEEMKCWGRKTIAEFDGEEVNIVVPVSQPDKTYIEIYGRFCRLFTKENYTEACRLAKKLFLGEEV